MKNRSVPVDTLVPHIVYRDVIEACEWFARVFGFTEHFRYGQPVSGIQIQLGEAYIMLTGPREGAQTPAELGRWTQMLTVIVPDAEAHHSRAKREGAEIVEQLHETIYGELQYGAKDLDRHRWIFSQHARDADPNEWGALVRQTPEKARAQ